jgi:hypothetical protein
MNIKNIFIALSFFIITSASMPSSANDEPIDINPEELIVKTITETDEDIYVSPTVQNLSKLYWALGKHDPSDTEAVENYLRINECNLFMQFYHNDFEWSNIVEATREYLKTSKNELPRDFELLTTIAFDRYDIENEIFELDASYKISGLRRIDFDMNSVNDLEKCGLKGYVPGYPGNMIVILNRPLNVEEVPVKMELAKLYLEEARSQFQTLPLARQMKQHERLAYLRLKIKILQYKETVRVTNNFPRAVVFGRLEGFEIYADPDRLKPLYFEQFDSRAERRDRIRKRLEQEERMRQEEELRRR